MVTPVEAAESWLFKNSNIGPKSTKNDGDHLKAKSEK
jgi:hypothetical protein